jgi:hypothetical protein
MKARVNTYALRQTRIDSASLGVLGTIAHPISDEGDYAATVLQRGIQVAAFQLKVDGEVKNPQADVDLATLIPERRRREVRFKEPSLAVTSKGYLVLYVSQGPGGFHVLLNKLGVDRGNEGEPRQVFDSRALEQGDVFIASLLRPGHYEVTDQHSEGRGQIKVAYPTPEKQPYVPPKPEEVSVAEEGFNPAELRIRAAQGVVFTIRAAKASLEVNLVEPDDGPREKGEIRDKIRWTNPSPPQA